MLSLEYKLLRFILVLSGAFLMCAFLATLLPVETMKATHAWLGLGDFPVAPITDYLARSTALMYGVHGTVMLFAGITIQHHWRFVALLGWLHVVIGLAMLAIDVHAAMPTYWTLVEGPPVAALGVLILILFQRGSAPESPVVA